MQAQIRRIFLDGYGILDVRIIEFTTATAVACQAMWLREFLVKVTRLGRQKMIIRFDNKSTIALSKNPVFHGRSKHIHTRYHFIRECVENEQGVIVDEFLFWIWLYACCQISLEC
ncbi:uncharacterized mitochondrial protein-like protein, partial [Tanacetum coccineum]